MSDQIIKKLKGVKTNEPLAPYTTFKIGGPAKYFYVAKNSAELLKAVKIAEEFKIPYFILGWGSNLLVSDDGFDGLVIKTRSDNFKITGQEIFAEAGINLSRLVGEATQAGLTGLEFMAGIPGTAGGAAWGNAGAYGKSFGDIVKELEIYQNGGIKTLSRADMKYGYRESLIKNQGGIILSVTIKLEPGDREKIQSKVIEIVTNRNERLPIDPSAGCIFKNIDLSKIEIDEDRVIKELDITRDKWKEVTRHGKLPVGFVVDCLGLGGKAMGGCQISKKHCAFLINTGKAKAEHVIMMISDIKRRVRNQIGIQLQEEVRYLGF